MTISKEVEAEIARLFYAEHWKVGTIVTQLGVHEEVVRRVLGLLDRKPRETRGNRPPQTVLPYVDFIRETLERYPRLPSSVWVGRW